MKKLTLCVWLILLAACHGSDDNESEYIPPTLGGDVEVSFGGSVSVITSSVSVSRSPINRATFDEGSEIGIYGMVANENNMGSIDWAYNTVLLDAMKNAKYTATNHYVTDNGVVKQSLVQEEIAKFPPKASPTSPEPALVFYAYYPYTTAVAYDPYGSPNAPVIPVNLDHQDMSNTPDYMYAKASSVVTTQPILLTFEHILTRLDFDLYTNIRDFGLVEGEIGSPRLKKIVVYQDKQYATSMSLAGLESLDPEQAMSPLALVYPNLDYVITYKTAAQNRFTGASFLLFPTCFVTKVVFTIVTEKGVERDFIVYQYVAGSTDPLKQELPLERGKITKLTVKYTREINPNAPINGWAENINLEGFTIGDNNSNVTP